MMSTDTHLVHPVLVLVGPRLDEASRHIVFGKGIV